jgi:hypothetical protein
VGLSAAVRMDAARQTHLPQSGLFVSSALLRTHATALHFLLFVLLHRFLFIPSIFC